MLAQSSPNVGNIKYATSYPGSDIGAQVNAAVAALPNNCGEVVVPAGRYTQTTTIVKPRCVKLDGEGALGTILNWQSTSGQAIVVADTTEGPNAYAEGEVADLTFNGQGASSSAIGVYIGGDPQGVVSSASASGDHQNLNRVRVLGFGTGVQWGNNAWSTTIFQGLISSDGTGLYFPSGLSNAGESIGIVNTRLANSNAGMNLIGFSDFYFYGSSCDYNTTCGYANAAHFYGMHFEQSSGTILERVS